jgi:hypothetical protein
VKTYLSADLLDVSPLGVGGHLLVVQQRHKGLSLGLGGLEGADVDGSAPGSARALQLLLRELKWSEVWFGTNEHR